MRINYFCQITFSLYTLSVLALPRATESHRRKGKNGREGPAVACFRHCTLPPEREPSLSTHPSPPCCKSPAPSGTCRKEWPSLPLFRLEPPPEPPPWVRTPRQPPAPWASNNGAPGWPLGSATRCKPCWAFGSGSGRRRRLPRTNDSAAICLHHPSYGLAPWRSIGAIPRRRRDVPLRTRAAASAPVLCATRV